MSKGNDERIDDLIEKIDSFMENGGGHMKIAGGEGEAIETYCTSCCGESSDTACNTPVKK